MSVFADSDASRDHLDVVTSSSFASLMQAPPAIGVQVRYPVVSRVVGASWYLNAWGASVWT